MLLGDHEIPRTHRDTPTDHLRRHQVVEGAGLDRVLFDERPKTGDSEERKEHEGRSRHGHTTSSASARHSPPPTRREEQHGHPAKQDRQPRRPREGEEQGGETHCEGYHAESAPPRIHVDREHREAEREETAQDVWMREASVAAQPATDDREDHHARALVAGRQLAGPPIEEHPRRGGGLGNRLPSGEQGLTDDRDGNADP